MHIDSIMTSSFPPQWHLHLVHQRARSSGSQTEMPRTFHLHSLHLETAPFEMFLLSILSLILCHLIRIWLCATGPSTGEKSTTVVCPRVTSSCPSPSIHLAPSFWKHNPCTILASKSLGKFARKFISTKQSFYSSS